MAAPVALVAIRVGRSAVGLGKRLRSRVGASGLPICRLMNLIAGADVHVGAVGLVVRVEVDVGAVADVARIVSVSAFPALLPPVEMALSAIVSDGNDAFVMSVSWVGLHAVRPNWTVAILVLHTVSAKLPKLMPPNPMEGTPKRLTSWQLRRYA